MIATSATSQNWGKKKRKKKTLVQNRLLSSILSQKLQGINVLVM
jgi:hypothetical protein